MTTSLAAAHRRDLEQYRSIGVTNVRILVDEAPELPRHGCTQALGCRCRALAAVEVDVLVPRDLSAAEIASYREQFADYENGLCECGRPILVVTVQDGGEIEKWAIGWARACPRTGLGEDNDIAFNLCQVLVFDLKTRAPSGCYEIRSTWKTYRGCAPYGSAPA